MAHNAGEAEHQAGSSQGSEELEKIDAQLALLMPLQKRTVNKVYMARLEANIRAVGLIEPLLVYRHDDGQLFILDGYLRYQVLLIIGETHAPCIVQKTLDLYTPNRQVNFISRSQRWKMLDKALSVVDEATLMASLDLREIRRGFSPAHTAALCAEALELEKKGQLSKISCYHLMNVTPERQREILTVSNLAGDFSSPFIRTQMLRTPAQQRLQGPAQRNPWNKAAETRKKLVDRLTEAERRHDFYQVLYRQYATDLILLASHVRQIVSITPLKETLAAEHPDFLTFFKQVMEQTRDQDEMG
jgi:hypothetical protein